MLDTHYDIVSLGSVLSTQDEASSRLRTTGRPTLVISERQAQGRGRQGRTWDEPERAMFSSYAFETVWEPPIRPLITLCTGVALAEAIEELCDIEVAVKWPNDLLAAGGKIAGILVESDGDVVTVGCGANLWWSEPPSYAEALFDDDPGPDLAMTLAKAWTDRLVDFLERGHTGWPKARYVERSWTLGKQVSWDGGEGTATGLDITGGLIVATSSGDVLITAGEVHTHQER